jgi:hypothetical protein
MQRPWFWLAAAIVCLPASRPAQAERPYREFLAALKQRGYYDSALTYLDELEADPKLPADLRVALSYERGVAYLELARASATPASQAQHLADAKRNFELFLEAQPEHPLAADANSQLANLALSSARVEIQESQTAKEERARDEHWRRARELITKARSIFQAAHDRNKTEWEKFPPHVRDRDEEQRAAWKAAETRYLQSQLDLALCTYEEARTHSSGSAEHKALLTQAADEFEALHEKYRSQGVGLFARMWQAKCFEEQDDIRRALDIYEELLSHPGTSPTVQMLQDQATWFRLICRNHPERRDQDSQLAIEEASHWLQQDKQRAQTNVGFAIRWERARAYQHLSQQRELSEQERARYRRLAFEDAQEISRFANPHHDQALELVQALNADLNQGATDPRDFDSALAIAQQQVAKISAFQERIAAAGQADRGAIESDLQLHLHETERLLKLALDLARNAKTEQINTVRYYLAYTYYLLGRSYEAGVLAEFIGRHYQQLDSQMALDAAYLAQAAYQQAYNDAPADERQAELEFMVRACRLITDSWPQSERATAARMDLGRFLNQMQQPAESARWYGEVPETAAEYASAQIAAGQALWTGYLQAALRDESERPAAEVLEQWRQDAKRYLETGIAAMDKRLSTASAAPEELTAAKVSLSQVLVADGNYEAAAQTLTAGPRSVVDAIEVAEGQERPDKGVRSSEFAALTYQLLLRAHIGLQQIDAALDAMHRLESVASKSDAQNVTAVYVQLGQELQQELTRLKELGHDARYSEVRRSFDQFLNAMFERKAGQSYGVLIWIAETYYGLAQAMQSQDESARAAYFDKAAQTYQAIVDRAGREPEFVTPPRLRAITLRLALCLREQGEHAKALAAVERLLKDQPKALDVQIVAAEVLESWGAAGQPQRYLDAIQGIATGAAPIWGWGQIAMRLQRAITTGGAAAEYEQRYYEARYRIANCRQRYARSQQDSAVRVKALETALHEIETLVAITGNLSDERWARFDELYRSLQEDLGRKPAVALARRTQVAIANGGVPPEADETPGPKPAAADATPAAPTAGSSSSLLLLSAVLAVFLVGAGGAAYAMTRGSSKRRRTAYAEFEPPSDAFVPEAKDTGSSERPRRTSTKPKPKGPRP